MALIDRREVDGAVLGIWKIEETEQELKRLLENPYLYDAQLSALINDKRRLEFLSVRVLTSQLLGNQKYIDYQPSGKPFLTDSSHQISISHTKGYAAVLLHPTSPVALDIETISKRVMNIQSRFMSEKELKEIDLTNNLIYTLLCWTAKETLFKRIDCKGVDFTKHLLVSPFKVATDGIIEVQELYSQQQDRFSFRYEVASEWIITYCIG